MIIRFFLAFIIASSAVTGISLLWPKFTSRRRPEPLQKVRDVIMETHLGKEAAQTLGVTDEKNVEPIQVSSVAATVVSNVNAVVRQKTEEIVTQQIVNQIVRQLEALPEEKRDKVREAVCKP